MKDSPAIVLAAGLAGMVSAFFPLVQGWLFEQSFDVMGYQLSAASLGILTVSPILFLPPLTIAILGGLAMYRQRFANRWVGALTVAASVVTLGGWYLQKSAIDRLSIVGAAPTLGLFLLLVSGLGGLIGGALLLAVPPAEVADPASN